MWEKKQMFGKYLLSDRVCVASHVRLERSRSPGRRGPEKVFICMCMFVCVRVRVRVRVCVCMFICVRVRVCVSHTYLCFSSRGRRARIEFFCAPKLVRSRTCKHNTVNTVRKKTTHELRTCTHSCELSDTQQIETHCVSTLGFQLPQNRS